MRFTTAYEVAEGAVAVTQAFGRELARLAFDSDIERIPRNPGEHSVDLAAAARRGSLGATAIGAASNNTLKLQRRRNVRV